MRKCHKIRRERIIRRCLMLAHAYTDVYGWREAVLSGGSGNFGPFCCSRLPANLICCRPAAVLRIRPLHRSLENYPCSHEWVSYGRAPVSQRRREFHTPQMGTLAPWACTRGKRLERAEAQRKQAQSTAERALNPTTANDIKKHERLTEQ